MRSWDFFRGTVGLLEMALGHYRAACAAWAPSLSSRSPCSSRGRQVGLGGRPVEGGSSGGGL